MKRGVRALGVAESYRGERSTLAGVVVRASRVVDGFSFGTCAVGGIDATDAVCDLYDALSRADVRYLFVSGIAPAWYNILDLHTIHERTGRPVLSVSYEQSDGLADAIREAFDGDAMRRRLSRYDDQPERRRLSVNDETIFVRSVGLSMETATEIVRGFTPEGGRPEPLRVARLAARGADSFRRDADGFPEGTNTDEQAGDDQPGA
ncbi:MAG: DUF99 family protein [Halodesulfurarchaeum sp.]